MSTGSVPAPEEAGGLRPYLADAIAGLSVAFVLVPQALAYAELAGLPAHRGLLAAAAAPIAASFFVSSRYLQTGPVALTSLLTFAALEGRAVLGSADYVLLAVLLAGVVGVVRATIGLVRAGRVAHLLSEPVLRGFTLAAVFLIVASQLPSALGIPSRGQGLVPDAFFALGGLRDAGWREGQAILLSTVTLGLMLGGRRLHPRFPGILVAMVGGLLVSGLIGYEGAVVGTIEKGSWGMPGPLPWERVPELLVPGVIIALVGFSEAVAISQTFAEKDGDEWNANQEFVSQGMGNLASAAAGAFPIGGSFSRSALNRAAGARSRLSGAVTGVALLIFLPFSSVIAPLPKAMLGAAVIGAVLPLLDPRPLLALVRKTPVQGAVGVFTLGLTVALAPRIELAVVAGVALALTLSLADRRSIEVTLDRGGEKPLLRPTGLLWYGSAGRLERRVVEALRGEECVSAQVDLSDLSGAGGTGRALVQDVLRRVRRRGFEIEVLGN
ncbi:MAG: SulP family inorganic anion transporter [Myxococcota bacterium]|nr:SulP family inorganic anion transporter [Myxococcota bacterium]